MMSVFCSNSLIHAPECGKCILRDPNFQNFPDPPRSSRFTALKLKMPSASFSISPPTSQILPSTLFLIENPAVELSCSPTGSWSLCGSFINL